MVCTTFWSHFRGAFFSKKGFWNLAPLKNIIIINLTLHPDSSQQYILTKPLWNTLRRKDGRKEGRTDGQQVTRLSIVEHAAAGMFKKVCAICNRNQKIVHRDFRFLPTFVLFLRRTKSFKELSKKGKMFSFVRAVLLRGKN